MTTLLGKPRLGRNEITPRPYQAEDVERIREGLIFARQIIEKRIAEDESMTPEQKARARRKPRLNYTLATGLGKSIVAGLIMRRAIEKGHRVGFFAHRKELISQPVAKLDMMGVTASVEQGDQYARAFFDPDAAVCMIQSMQRDRLLSWDPNYFDLIIIDESHHAPCASYLSILNYFRKAVVIGMTATSKRGDGEDLGQVFDHTVTGMNLAEGMKSGFLCDVRVESYNANIDLRDLRMSAGDFSDADLEERIRPMVGQLANGLREKAGDRPTLVFTPQIASAQGMASALQSIGVNAQWASGEDPLREEKVLAYRRGDIQMLAAANLFLEGTDLPETACLGLCRPTTNESLLAQMLGRGLRPKSAYTDCVIVDFNFLMPDFKKLAKPIQLFDSPNLDLGVLDEAQAILNANPEMSLLVAFEKGEEVHKEKKELRIKAKEAKVSWDCTSYRPIEFYETMGLAWRGPQEANAQPSTEKQANFLEKSGISNADQLSKSHASDIINYLMNRSEAQHPDGSIGYASHKMIRMMIRQKVPPDVARNMSKTAADEWRKKKFEQWSRFKRYKRKG